MISEEAKSAPGGVVALYLFLMGAACLFVSVLMVALSIGEPESVHIGSGAWLFPTWGIAAIMLAFARRRSSGAMIRLISGFWLVIGLAATLFIVLGTKLTVG